MLKTEAAKGHAPAGTLEHDGTLSCPAMATDHWDWRMHALAWRTVSDRPPVTEEDARSGDNPSQTWQISIKDKPPDSGQT